MGLEDGDEMWPAHGVAECSLFYPLRRRTQGWPRLESGLSDTVCYWRLPPLLLRLLSSRGRAASARQPLACAVLR